MDVSDFPNDPTSASVLWREPANIGPKLLYGGTAVKAEIGHMPNKYGGVVGEDVFASGCHLICFEVTAPESANVAIGFCDAEKPQTSETSGPHAWGLHLGRGRLVQSLNSHQFAGPQRKIYRSAARKEYKARLGAGASLKVLFILDMSTRHLSVVLDEHSPVDTGFMLPETVRPWLWLGGPGCGTVSAVKLLDSEPIATPALPTPPLEIATSPAADDGGTGIGLGVGLEVGIEVASVPEQSAERPEETPQMAMRLDAKATPLKGIDDERLSPKAVEVTMAALAESHVPDLVPLTQRTESTTARTDCTTPSSDSGDGPLPQRWTAAAASWLLPLQQALFREQTAPDERLEA